MMLHKRNNFKKFYFFRGNFWIFFISRMFRKINSNDSCNYFVLRKATEWKVILSCHHFIAFINDPAFPEFCILPPFYCIHQWPSFSRVLKKFQFPLRKTSYAETVPFRKISTPGNQLKLRYFSQCSGVVK